MVLSCRHNQNYLVQLFLCITIFAYLQENGIHSTATAEEKMPSNSPFLPKLNRGKKQTIYFGAFLSNIDRDEMCFKAAIDTAVKLINRDDNLLKNYHLKIKYFDNYVCSCFYTDVTYR